MGSMRVRRPSASMVVALLALIVALGGTAIAGPTAQLARLVRGDKVLKKHSLSGNRLKNHTITGRQIKLSKLGKVRSAGTADVATTAAHAGSADSATIAQTVAASEAFHEVGTPGQPGFQHSWQNSLSTAYETAGFYKDAEGIVHLKGAVIGGSSNNAIFQLPPGYRPASGKLIVVAAACACQVTAADPQGGAVTLLTEAGSIAIEGSGFGAGIDGSVSPDNTTVQSGQPLFLDGISFRAGS
jgi:hypothetical protein